MTITFNAPIEPIGVRQFKRYPNRKLYDPFLSTYVTLAEIYSYVEAGTPVQIINNRTKKDVTTSVLRNALVEKGKGASNGSIANMLEHVAGYIKGEQNVE